MALELEDFLNPAVGVYLALVLASVFLPPVLFRCWDLCIRLRRRKAGLPDDILLSRDSHLKRRLWESLVQAGFLLTVVVVAPFVIAGCPKIHQGGKEGLAVIFLSLLAWLLWQGTDVARAFLGGLAFRTFAAFKGPLQVGDKVTLKSHRGTVTEIGAFYVGLKNSNGERISIPSHQLWSETLLSSNAGERWFQCEMKFYLSPHVKPAQRQLAEDILWEAMQASPYCEVSRPIQIYLHQTPEAICLIATASVASLDQEAPFRSDVTRIFLDEARKQGIPLASV